MRKLKRSQVVTIGLLTLFLVIFIVLPLLRKETLSGKQGPAPYSEVGKIYIPILPPDRASERRLVVNALNVEIEAQHYRRAAMLNAELSQEAFGRVYRVLKAWEPWIDPETGLIPKAKHPTWAFWNAQDNGADFYPYLLMASLYLDRKNSGKWIHMLDRERRLCGPMPCTVLFGPARIEKLSQYEMFFGAAEFMKDGLQTVTDAFGQGPWFTRLKEIMDETISVLPVQPAIGKRCSEDSELNGDWLQVLPRLYWATGKPEYLRLAEEISETYLFYILPRTGYLPPRFWDFERQNMKWPYISIRDHGNEIIPGLSEVYFLEKKLGRPQSVRYRAPLKRMLDAVLSLPRSGEGIWYSQYDIKTRQPSDHSLSDTWGYVLNAYQTFDLAEGTHEYEEEIRRYMRAVARLKSFPWEGQYMDGYADSIESMLYLMQWFDMPGCRFWVDDEIEIMFSKQFPSGFVEEWYLDGNFIRTALWYAMYKTQGVVLDPWSQDVKIGAVTDARKTGLYLHLSASKPWKGVIRFDVPRHHTIWHIPYPYPRLNQLPEWFVIDKGKRYMLTDIDTGKTSVLSGEALIKGLPVSSPGSSYTVNYRVSER